MEKVKTCLKKFWWVLVIAVLAISNPSKEAHVEKYWEVMMQQLVHKENCGDLAQSFKDTATNAMLEVIPYTNLGVCSVVVSENNELLSLGILGCVIMNPSIKDTYKQKLGTE